MRDNGYPLIRYYEDNEFKNVRTDALLDEYEMFKLRVSSAIHTVNSDTGTSMTNPENAKVVKHQIRLTRLKYITELNRRYFNYKACLYR